MRDQPRARRLEVRVGEGRGALHADIADDGRGLDPEAPAAGFGLAGMRERVALLNGELAIVSSEGGTRIAVALPLG